jgi:hypothetical protein
MALFGTTETCWKASLPTSFRCLAQLLACWGSSRTLPGRQCEEEVVAPLPSRRHEEAATLLPVRQRKEEAAMPVDSARK